MNPVFAKTRELAEAIMHSEEYTAMKAAENAAMKNEQAANAMSEYLEKRHAIETLLAEDHPDPVKLKELSDEIDISQQKLKLVPDVVALTTAREGFSELINQVNRVLRFMITGETGEADEESSCTGSCSTCGGCGRLN